MSINYTTTPTTSFLNFNGTTSTALPVPPLICGLANEITGGAGSFTSSVPANITTAGTLVLKMELNGTINSITIPSYYAVRIA